MQTRREDEDIDDILSSIVQGQRASGPITNPVEAIELQKKAKLNSQPDLSRESMLKRNSEFIHNPKTNLDSLNIQSTTKPTPVEPIFSETQESSFFSGPTPNNPANNNIATAEPINSIKNEQTPQQTPPTTLNIPYLSDADNKSEVSPANKPKQNKKSKHRNTKTIKKVLIAGVLIFAVSFIVFGVVYRETFIAYVLPQSPFSKELNDAIQYPLLYPSKPPLGYSIDESSVSKGSNGVIVYNLKNPKGDLIGISLQSEPSNLNIEALLSTLTNPRTVAQPAGSTIIGTSKDEITTAHTLTGTVWVITRVPKGVVPESAIETMLSSLKEG